MKILFQGDSITDWFRRGDRDDIMGSNYVTMIAGEMGRKFPEKYEFLYRGISGSRSVDILARMPKDIISLKPDVLSLLIVINDVWHRTFDSGITPEQYEIVCNLLIKFVKEALPDIKIMILEPFVLKGSATAEKWSFFKNETKLIAKAAKKVAKDNKLIFVPLQKRFDEAQKLTKEGYWLIDGVHPTAAGHYIIKEAWQEAFYKNFG